MRNEIGWVEKFYPVTADDCDLGKEIEHSLLKWTGLRVENLDEFGLDNSVPISVSSSSCALCVRFYSPFDEEFGTGCINCPIVKEQGRCCDADDFEEDNSQWGAWIHQRDPEPMIDLLKRCLATKQRSLPNSHAEGH